MSCSFKVMSRWVNDWRKWHNPGNKYSHLLLILVCISCGKDAYYTVIRGAVSIYFTKPDSTEPCSSVADCEDLASAEYTRDQYGVFLLQLPPGEVRLLCIWITIIGVQNAHVQLVLWRIIFQWKRRPLTTQRQCYFWWLTWPSSHLEELNHI